MWKSKVFNFLGVKQTTHHQYVHGVHYTVCAYMSIHVLYDHVWAEVWERFILLIPLFLRLNYSFRQQNSFIALCPIPPPLCLPCPFSLTKHNTFSCPLLLPVHLLSSLCPVLILSSSHILFYPLSAHFNFLYLTLSLSVPHFFFTSFSGPLLPTLFFSLSLI